MPAPRYWLLNSLLTRHLLLHALQARKWESWEGPWCVRCHIGPWFGRWSPELPLLLHVLRWLDRPLPLPAVRLRRYFTLGAATAMLAIGLSARPDSSLTYWADRKAAENKGSA